MAKVQIEITFSQYDQPWFYFAFVIIGILGGLYCALFNKINYLLSFQDYISKSETWVVKNVKNNITF